MRNAHGSNIPTPTEKTVMNRTSIFVALTAVMLTHYFAAAHAQVGAGFNQVGSNEGVEVFQRGRKPGRVELMTVVNLERATVRSVTGPPTDKPNANIGRARIADLWREATRFNSRRQAVVLINGTFFDNTRSGSSPTSISLGLKVDGSTYSYGSKRDSYGDLKRLLVFNDTRAAVVRYDSSVFDQGEWQNAVGGFSVNQSIDDRRPTGRTWVGVQDRDRNGSLETMLIYSNRSATKAEVTDALRGFGIQDANIIQLDGGLSHGFVLQGTTIFQPLRQTPHCIAVYSGKG